MIFNELIASSGGGGGKVATWTFSGSATMVTSISFTVDAEPTQWILICAGPSSGSFFSASSSNYYIMSAVNTDGGYPISTHARVYSSRQRVSIDAKNNLTSSYSNGVFTLTTINGRGFMTNSNYAYVTYYLLYNTN